MSQLSAPLPDPSQGQSQADSSARDPNIPPLRSIIPPHDSPRMETPAVAMANAAAEGLSDHQRKVMMYLAAGHGIAKAAHLGKVNRKTVYRWLKNDAHFCAVYNAWRKELELSAKTRALAMADDALDTIHGAILTGNVNASLAVAKSLGLLEKPRIGSDDPNRIATKRRARQMRQAAADLKTISDARFALPMDHPLRYTPEELAQMEENDRRRREEYEQQRKQKKQPEWVERYRQATEARSTQDSAPQPEPAPTAEQSADSDDTQG